MRDLGDLMSTNEMISGSTQSSAPVETLWAVWTDPSGWVGGPVESASADGVFGVGTSYTVKVRRNRPVTATITQWDPMRSWTSVSRMPGLRLTLHHVLEPGPSGVLITEGVVFSGPLARIVTALFARRLRATYAETTAHCARLADARSSAQ